MCDTGNFQDFPEEMSFIATYKLQSYLIDRLVFKSLALFSQGVGKSSPNAG